MQLFVNVEKLRVHTMLETNKLAVPVRLTNQGNQLTRPHKPAVVDTTIHRLFEGQ